MAAMNNLKKYRERAGLSQTKLSELSGCARSYISEVEMGHQKLTLKMAEKFAPHLHCTAFDLLGADAIKYTGSFTESLGALVFLICISLVAWRRMRSLQKITPSLKNGSALSLSLKVPRRRASFFRRTLFVPLLNIILSRFVLMRSLGRVVSLLS